MKFHLLIGAGFSRNWGGWLSIEVFEYLLGCPEIRSNNDLKRFLWDAQRNGNGFEDALANLENSLGRSSLADANPAIFILQDAIRSMFENMNASFGRVNWEFQSERERSITDFLARFDNIFTLNQDTLLEQNYSTKIGTNSVRRWNGLDTPGMQKLHNTMRSDTIPNLTPYPIDRFRVSNGTQPFFKLHGSSNWFREEGSQMLIIGGSKEISIDKIPILKWYAKEFSRRLREAPSQLMIIGYGFRDHHINKILLDAVKEGLKIFVIAPEGADVIYENKKKTKKDNDNKYFPTEMESIIENALIGASRRPLTTIFGNDVAEHSKLMRFFSV